MTTNNLLKIYIKQIGLRILDLKDNNLPGNILLEQSKSKDDKINQRFITEISLLDDLICTKEVYYNPIKNVYTFTNYGKKVMNKVVKCYLENFIKDLT